MNATVNEWLAKAKADLTTAERELAVKENPNYDAVCFHAQQSIEKHIKAMLIHFSIVPTKTHDLHQLSGVLASVARDWWWPSEELRFLTRAAVAFRYPGESADFEVASIAVDIAKRIRTSLDQHFKQGMPG